MTINHIDQLTEWWENAEVPTSATLPKDGDRIIIRYNSEWYEVATADGDASVHDLSSYTRILARAPKPKPAWYDAVAVIASTDYCERQVWKRESDGTYSGSAGDVADDYELRDVTPLIEAKVTDEMVERGLGEAEEHGYIERVFGEVDGIDQNAFRAILTAALGLEIA